MENLNNYSIALIHSHSDESDGMVTPTELVSAAAQVQEELETPVLLALTDHDSIRGLSEAYCASNHFGIQLVAGQEVSAGRFPSKHILALFEEEPQNPMARGKTPEATIDEIKSQNGLVVIAHADGFGGLASLTSNEIDKLGNRDAIDGIESINGTYNRRKQLRPLLEDLRKYRPIAEIGAPDSHFGKKDLLTSYSLFEGNTVSDLFEAIKHGETISMVGIPHIVTTWDRIIQNVRSNIVLNFRRYVTDSL